MMRLIDRGFIITVLASYLISAALIVLGLLTVIVALFTGHANAQLGGAAVVLVALLMLGAALLAHHTHGRNL